MKPKVLFVSINFFSPEYLDGTNKITYNLLKERELYAASFFSLFPGALSKAEQDTFSHINIFSINHSKKVEKKYSKLRLWIEGKPFISLSKKVALLIANELERLSHQYDIIHLTSLNLASCIEFLSPESVKKITLGATDSYSMFTERRIQNEKSPIKKMLLRWELKLARSFEEKVYKASPKTIFVSKVDEQYSRRFFPQGNYMTIPLGVDTSYFHRCPTSTQVKKNQIIFSGNLAYGPNKDASLFLVHEIYPILKKLIPGIKIILAGANPPTEIVSLDDPQIVTTGRVEDLRTFIWESELFICPLRFGSGMKNKVLEVLSMEKKSIFSDIALEGIPDTEHLPKLGSNSNASAWADMIAKVLKDPQRYSKNIFSTREFVKKHFSWKARTKSYSKLFKEHATNP